MIGDIVFSVLVFIVWGGVNLCVYLHVLLWLVEEGNLSSDCLECWIVDLHPLQPPTSLKRTSFSAIVLSQWNTAYRESNQVLSLILFKFSREITVETDNRGQKRSCSDAIHFLLSFLRLTTMSVIILIPSASLSAFLLEGSNVYLSRLSPHLQFCSFPSSGNG